MMKSLGYTSFVEENAKPFLDEGFSVARVTEENRENYLVNAGAKDIPAEISGKLRFTAEGRGDFPAVGDWVAVSLFDNNAQAIIHSVLPRRTMIARKAAGKRTELQLIAANIDIVFIVQGLDDNFNLRRLERYLVVANESGATPVVLLSKLDLLPSEVRQDFILEARKVTPGVELLAYSAITGESLDGVRRFIKEGTTVCFIGSSGVGKSTLINALIGENLLPTEEVREADSRGRHTTARRQMLFLPTGGILIDTPGMRELGLWHADSGLDETFPEIAELAEECRFRDCTHTHEPGCAVLMAVEEGTLDPGRYESYAKLRDEADQMEQRTTVAGRLERKRREKIIGRAIKQVLRLKGKE